MLAPSLHSFRSKADAAAGSKHADVAPPPCLLGGPCSPGDHLFLLSSLRHEELWRWRARTRVSRSMYELWKKKRKSLGGRGNYFLSEERLQWGVLMPHAPITSLRHRRRRQKSRRGQTATPRRSTPAPNPEKRDVVREGDEMRRMVREVGMCKHRPVLLTTNAAHSVPALPRSCRCRGLAPGAHRTHLLLGLKKLLRPRAARRWDLRQRRPGRRRAPRPHPPARRRSPSQPGRAGSGAP